jgi:hypothetical protein
MILPMTSDTDDFTDATTEPEAGEADDLSLREELTRALADAGEDAPELAAAAPPARDAHSRDALGRFARTDSPSPNPPETPGPDAPAFAGVTPSPVSWSAAAKADFQSLPEHIRKEVLKREADMERGRAQWQSSAERLNRLDAVIGPRADYIRMRGMDEARAIQALFAAQDLLDRNPVEGLTHLARTYGVDLRALAMATAPQQQPRTPSGAQPPAQLTALAREVETLKGALEQQRQRAEDSHKAGVLGQVEAFAADPANLYFENVRGRMTGLLRAGAAKDVAEAYQQAIWGDPEVRAQLLRQQAAARPGSSDAARAKAAQARHASGSITGSPSPGSRPGRGGPAPSLREELLNAWSHHAV